MAELNSILESGDINYSHKRGFNRYDVNSMGVVTYGDATTRTFSLAVKSGESKFIFFADGKLFEKTTTQTLACPDVTGTYYWYFDTAGVLQVALNGEIPHLGFVKSAICGMAYYNKEEATFEGAVDEQHGVDGSGGWNAEVHFQQHLTQGLKHGHGGDIVGLADGSSTYTNIAAAFHFDEDIAIDSPEETAHSFMYRKTTNGVTGWVFTAPDNNIGYKEGGNSNVSLNKDLGSGVWGLEVSASATDFIIYLVGQTNLITHKRVKVIGQQSYASRPAARTGLKEALKTVNLQGLSSAEFEWQYAYICKKNGTLEDSGAPNNDLVVDLRGININSL